MAQMNTYSVSLLCAGALGLALCACAGRSLAAGPGERADGPICISGVYPHLAAFSHNGECGIGAVVPWAGKLWFITYPPHHTTGGPDKLYEVAADLTVRIRPESVGGTHAGRMIHRESKQLVLGPYFIDTDRNVRAADVKTKLVGRMTAVMRHLTDPAHKVYFFDMEGKIYEADVRTLEVTKLFDSPIPGDHGKGGYTAQGRVVISNNGERRVKDPEQVGALGEWDGQRWRVVERKQFCEVTGPGGINGSPDEASPLWATGWDRRSVVLKLLDGGKWYTYRLPKASQCYDGTHGWYTEWPRIREIAPGRLMMDVHGMFYDFPAGFRAAATGGLRPMATHLRMIVDYCNWNGRVVLASDDTSIMANPAAGQSQSNLWFRTPEQLGDLGRPAGWGGPWLRDRVAAGEVSDPFLIKGFGRRCLHLSTRPGREGGAAVAMRCTGRFEMTDLPDKLRPLPRVTVGRGDFHKPAPGYAFTVNRPVTVYMGVDGRCPEAPEGWAKTDLSLKWDGYTDVVYERQFKAGRVEVPGHERPHKPDAYCVPNICFVCDASGEGGGLEIAGLPDELQAQVAGPAAAAAEPAPAATGPVTFELEIDRDGSGKWEAYREMTVPPEGYAWHVFAPDFDACWIRLKAKADCTATAVFHYSAAGADREADAMFAGLPAASEKAARWAGIVRPAGGEDRNLQFLATRIDRDGKAAGEALYEVDERLKFHRVADAEAKKMADEVREKAAVKRDFSVDAASAIITRGPKRYRLPKASDAYDEPSAAGWPRGLREVVTERNLLNCCGTFYEVPRDNSAGLAAMRPVATHGRRIDDFCTWRGLLVMSGTAVGAKGDGHTFAAGGDDGVGLWFGVVDDLWKLGKPRGVGGPWRDTPVRAGERSDPYLMTGFDGKVLTLSHDADEAVTFTVEVDFTADGNWAVYKAVRVPPKKAVSHQFPAGYSARWVRFAADKPCRATAWLVYE